MNYRPHKLYLCEPHSTLAAEQGSVEVPHTLLLPSSLYVKTTVRTLTARG